MIRKATYSEGSLNSAIAIVGEAPGEMEERSRAPFIGQAGDMLNRLMMSAGIIRSLCYLDNVFQFRPAGNNVKPHLDTSKKPPLEGPEFARAKEELIERLRASKANIVIALGNTALYTLVGMTGILDRRGSVYWSEAIGKKVIAALHPAALLAPRGRRDLVAGRLPYIYQRITGMDFKRAEKESHSPEYKPTYRDLKTSPGFPLAENYLLEILRKKQRCAFDIEVKFGELSHIAFATSAHSAVSIPLVEGMKRWFNPEQEARLLLLSARIIEDPDITKITQNGTFDATFLYRKYGIRPANIEDTMIGMGIAYPELPKGLDFICSVYCNGEPYYKSDGKEWFKNPFPDEEVFRRYNALDAAVTFEAFDPIMRDLDQLGTRATYEAQKRLILPLVFMGEKGMRMDVAWMRAKSKEVGVELVRMKKEIQTLCDAPVNPDSTQQMMRHFYITSGIRPYTNNGRPTLDDKALSRLVAKGIPEAEILQEYRRLKKLKGTYLDMKLDPDGRVRCSFNPVGSKTRLSSSKTIFGTGANFQNLHPDLKAVILPDEGYWLIQIDLAQAENRVVAYVAGETNMMEAFDAGRDIHAQTAALMHGVPLESVDHDLRQDGKRANHGFNYDWSARAFALYHSMPESRAKWIRERYFEIYPGVLMWHEAIQEKLRKDRTLVDCFGNRRIFLDQWGTELFKEAYSYQPQRTVAYAINIWGLLHIYERQDLYEPISLLNQVHDSVVFQWPAALGLEALYESLKSIKASIEQTITWHDRTFYIPADISIGYNAKEVVEIKSADFSERTFLPIAAEHLKL